MLSACQLEPVEIDELRKTINQSWEVAKWQKGYPVKLSIPLLALSCPIGKEPALQLVNVL
jgi:hypothetical protein